MATVYAGKVVEIGEVYTIFRNPHHPYTIGLIKAVPTLTSDKSELTSIPGSPPDLIELPIGLQVSPALPAGRRPLQPRSRTWRKWSTGTKWRAGAGATRACESVSGVKRDAYAMREVRIRSTYYAYEEM